VSAPENRLLAVFPRDIHQRLGTRMRTVDLPHGQVLQRPGETIERVYFPLTCLISITVTMTDGATSEAGIVGNREMVGVNAFMGGRETTQTEYVAQVPGLAVLVPAEPLLAEFDRNKPLRDVMLRYTQAYIAQLSQNVACNRQHDIRQRLARWLLECRDRIQSDDFRLTHEFISQMLGVRRAGISEAASALQKDGLIEYGQKAIRITDAERLKEGSCECYGVLRDEYNRLLGVRTD
jgi:CRP-like cAMP-binding protein